MRAIVVTSLFVVLGFAGCIDDGLLPDDDKTGSTRDPFQADINNEEHREMPERSFEPELILDAPELIELQVEQGTQVNFTFNITDLHDYPFPLTFVDWNLTYSREPNPVAEGDAHDLPAEWNRTLFAEDHHAFRFNVDDGQGFKANTTIIIKVGDPPDIEEVVFVEEEPEGPPTGYPRDLVLSAPIDCPLCVDGGTDAWGVEATGYPGAFGCSGFLSGVNYQDCAWVNIIPAAWGEPFSVTSTMRADGAFNAAGDQGSVDVDFLDSCKPSANSITHEFIDTGTLEAEGVIPEGARCMVAFEFHWPTGEGVDFHFQWNERPDEPLNDPWFDSGTFRPGRTTWYNGVLMTPDPDSGCIGDAANCGPSSCPGLASGANGHGCAWIEVTPNLWEMRFSVTSHADHDGFAMTSCSPDADVIETYGAVGPEQTWALNTRVIPENAGCIMVSDWAGQSSVVTFEIVSPP